MKRTPFSNGGVSVNGGGSNFAPGHWRADQSSGRVAVPAGPQGPIERVGDFDAADSHGSRKRDPRTAANLQQKADALAPRRYTRQP